MTRVLTALVLLPTVIGIVWYGPPAATMGLVGVVTLLAFLEYAGMARQASPGFPATVSGAVTLATYAAAALDLRLELVLAPGLLVTGLVTLAQARTGDDAVRRAAVALFPACYLGIPLGLAVALRTQWSAAVLLVPFLAIVVSDSSQYYVGRMLGKRPLAPGIRPKEKGPRGARRCLPGGACPAAARALHPCRGPGGGASGAWPLAPGGRIGGNLFKPGQGNPGNRVRRAPPLGLGVSPKPSKPGFSPSGV